MPTPVPDTVSLSSGLLDAFWGGAMLTGRPPYNASARPGFKRHSCSSPHLIPAIPVEVICGS